MIKNICRFLFVFFLFISFAGCSRNIPTPQERYSVAQEIAEKNSLHVKVFHTKDFDLLGEYNKLTCKELKVYIEGDGLAWITSSTISDDPTPLNPLALKLMALDKASCKLYLSRPCQYVKNFTCKEKYWRSHRFSEEVIKSYDELLTQIKQEYKTQSFSLVGYSGGGAVVTLLSARRDDISYLSTVAGNLDTNMWTTLHHISALEGSLNPANYANKLAKIPQYHFIGKKDRVIPQEVFNSYFENFSDKSNIKYDLYDASHSEGWEEVYQNLR